MLRDESPYKEIAGRVALVTGGASGIGRAIAKILGQAKATVVVADIDAVGGEAVVKDIRSTGGMGRYFPCDVTQAQACQSTAEAIKGAFGGLHILVNAAGLILRATVAETSEADWDRILDVNLKGTFLMCKHALPVMIEGGGGAIVNIASGWGLVGGRRAAAYCASKGGVVLLTKAMALDHAHEKVRVNCLCPGDVNTPMLKSEARQLGMTMEAFLVDAADRPLGRIGTPQEIAQAALFLASEAATFITGTTLVVDGGGLAGVG